jgi:hypothetical protein
MNRKHLNILLLICVAFIWGLVIYKALGKTFGADIKQHDYTVESNKILPKSVQKDTFKLKPYKRDPFLGIIRKGNIPISNDQKSTKITPVVKVQWPHFQYLGFVMGETAKEPLLLLKVNGKLLRKKSSFEFYEGMKVLRFYKDSLLLKFNSEEKVLFKN